MGRIAKIKNEKGEWIDVPRLKLQNAYHNKFYYDMYIRERDGVNAGKWVKEDNWIRPIKLQQTLDNSLDIGSFTIWMVGRKEIYKPFTVVRFEVYEWHDDPDNDQEVSAIAYYGRDISMDQANICAFSKRIENLKGKTVKIKGQKKVLVDCIYMYISSDTVTQKAYAQPKKVEDVGDRSKYKGIDLFNHDIQLIELTKELERVGNDTLSFTRYLGHYYDPTTQTKAIHDIEIGNNDYKWILENFIQDFVEQNNNIDTLFNETLMKDKQIKIKVSNIFSFYKKSIIKILDGEVLYEASLENLFLQIIEPNGNKSKFNNDCVFSFNSLGDYIIEYHIKIHGQYHNGLILENNYIDNAYIVSYRIKVMKPLTKGAKIDFNVASAIERTLEVVPTRRENVEQQNYVLKDEWKKKLEKVLLPEMFCPQKTLYETLSLIVANCQLIPRLEWDNMLDKARIITFDEIGGNKERIIKAKTAYYTSNLSIDRYCNSLDSTASNLINTREYRGGVVIEPSLDSFTTTRAEDGQVEINDDTSIIKTTYPIYEIESLICNYKNKDYDITSFVYEKSEYNSMLKNVGDAGTDNFPYTKACALCYSQGDNAITELNHKNIEELEGAISSIKAILLHVSGVLPDDMTVKDFKFRITYKTINELRTIQKKVRFDANEKDNSLIFNQTESTIENSAYGENMKGAIARMGLQTEEYTYYFKKYDDIPRIGELVEDKYVVSIALEPELNWIKASVSYTKNYNMLMQYMGLNSNLREFDVSEKQAFERHVLYSEDIIIGDKMQTNNNKTMLSEEGVKLFANTFIQNDSNPITCAYTQGLAINRDDEGNEIEGEKDLIAITKPVSACALGNTIQFHFNYVDNFSAGTKADNWDIGRKEQKEIPYCDDYGEIKKLKLLLSKNMDIDAYNYPEVYNKTNEYLINCYDNPLIIKKDSREYLNICIALCLRINRDDIIIGTQLIQNNALIKMIKNQNDSRAKLCFFTKKLNMLNQNLEIDKELNYDISNIIIEKDKIILTNILNSTNNTYVAWGLVEHQNEATYPKLYIGQNIKIEPNEKVNDVYINFIDNVSKLD